MKESASTPPRPAVPAAVQHWPGIVEAFRAWLPIGDDEPALSLMEGNTPLVPADRLMDDIPPENRPPGLFLKFEGLNPTGSFKDRGMAFAVTKARNEGVRAVICASTGNTAASAAAYAARAGITCYVVLPAGGVALGKVAQALAHGARLVQVEGNFDDALAAVREVVDRRSDLVLVNSLNPNRVQGQKTASLEIVEQLRAGGHGDPEAIVLPVGNAGNITAYAMGLREYHGAGRLSRVPALHGIQAEGADPLVKGHPIDNPTTIASAIRIGRPASGDKALQVVEETNGSINSVSDEEILTAYRLLAQKTGVFCEPASAASVAGFRKLAAAGTFRGARGPVVCVLTGHGLKDPETASSQAAQPLAPPVQATAAALAEVLEGAPVP